MAISKQDREDYEESLRDSHRGILETVFNDVIVNHPDSSPYYKGREGEQLDEDKRSKDTDE